MINRIVRGFSHCKFIGYPFAGGQPRKGVEKTPEWLFNQSWFKAMNDVSSHNIDFERKHENTLYKDFDENLKYMLEYSDVLALETQKSLDEKNFTVVIGGDHSQGLGSIKGVRKSHKNCKVIWVDAHMDVHSP